MSCVYSLRRVIIESPFRAADRAGRIRNVRYARLAVAHALWLGEAPIASHLLYTQPGILDDEDPAERRLGIDAGLTWLSVAEAVALYVDLGISEGMAAARHLAGERGLKVEVRSLGPNWQFAGDAEKEFP